MTTRVLLAAAAGAAVLSMVNCGPMPSGNLLAPVCADGGAYPCDTADSGTQADAGSGDAGTLGGDY